MRISACGMRCLLGALVFLLHALMQAEPSLARAVSDRHPHSSDGALSASLISAQHDVQRRYLPDTMVSGAQWNTRTTSANTVGANVCYVQGKTYRFGTTWQMKGTGQCRQFRIMTAWCTGRYSYKYCCGNRCRGPAYKPASTSVPATVRPTSTPCPSPTGTHPSITATTTSTQTPAVAAVTATLFPLPTSTPTPGQVFSQSLVVNAAVYGQQYPQAAVLANTAANSTVPVIMRSGCGDSQVVLHADGGLVVSQNNVSRNVWIMPALAACAVGTPCRTVSTLGIRQPGPGGKYIFSIITLRTRRQQTGEVVDRIERIFWQGTALVHALTLLNDGNLALTDAHNVVLWSTNTRRSPHPVLACQQAAPVYATRTCQRGLGAVSNETCSGLVVAGTVSTTAAQSTTFSRPAATSSIAGRITPTPTTQPSSSTSSTHPTTSTAVLPPVTIATTTAGGPPSTSTANPPTSTTTTVSTTPTSAFTPPTTPQPQPTSSQAAPVSTATVSNKLPTTFLPIGTGTLTFSQPSAPVTGTPTTATATVTPTLTRGLPVTTAGIPLFSTQVVVVPPAVPTVSATAIDQVTTSRGILPTPPGIPFHAADPGTLPEAKAPGTSPQVPTSPSVTVAQGGVGAAVPQAAASPVANTAPVLPSAPATVASPVANTTGVIAPGSPQTTASPEPTVETTASTASVNGTASTASVNGTASTASVNGTASTESVNGTASPPPGAPKPPVFEGSSTTGSLKLQGGTLASSTQPNDTVAPPSLFRGPDAM